MNECCNNCDLDLKSSDCSEREILECQILYLINKYNKINKQSDSGLLFYDFIYDNLGVASCKQMIKSLIDKI